MRGHFLRTAHDADALKYSLNVQTADAQPLEADVHWAKNQFVLYTKADGNWNAIKASCILAGARTLAGALVPLAGTAPTNFNFVSGDYNRKTGLWPGSTNTTKHLDSNRNNSADPQNNNHNAVYVTQHGTSTSLYMSASASSQEFGDNNLGIVPGNFNFVRSRVSQGVGIPGSWPTVPGLCGTSRSSSAQFSAITSNVQFNSIGSSQTPFNSNIEIFAGKTGATLQYPTNARLAFYSIGESLNLALLDARFKTLINTFAAAIP